MRTGLSWLLFTTLLLPVAAIAQEADNSVLTSCTFADQMEISARYVPAPSKAKLPDGKVWSPGGAPIVLFTQTEMTAGGATLPVGAFRAYVLPVKGSWTFIISKDVNGKTYDPAQDVVRIPMQSGSLSSAADPYTLVFAHDAPQQCSLQLYYGKNGYWVEFKEK